MTVAETLYYISTIVDDRIFVYAGQAYVESCINEAQNAKLDEYYANQDERALRPFHTETTWIQSNTTAPQNFLYPRAGLIAAAVSGTPPVPTGQTWSARYEDYGAYINYANPSLTNRVSVQEADYTVYSNMIFFRSNLAGERLKLYYIRKPLLFSIANNQPLELPQEYHAEVATYAAYLINQIDINEKERERLQMMQQLNLQVNQKERVAPSGDLQVSQTYK